VRIFSRLNTLEKSTTELKECYNMRGEKYDHIPTNSKPTNWLPSVKIDIGGETFYACCDIMSELCLMPRDIYESLNIWGLSEGGEEIYLTNNVVIFFLTLDCEAKPHSKTIYLIKDI
jgi:hypothetical protein